MLAAAISPLLREVPPEVPLVPMPLHQSRLRSRGYNQAHEVARLLAAELPRQLISDVLVRNKATRMQAELPGHERRANVNNAFTVRQPLNVDRVLLVDDVMTTGQTMHAASQCLLAAGVGQVDAVVFARSG